VLWPKTVVENRMNKTIKTDINERFISILAALLEALSKVTADVKVTNGYTNGKIEKPRIRCEAPAVCEAVKKRQENRYRKAGKSATPSSGPISFRSGTTAQA
jgi:hypothetical protein